MSIENIVTFIKDEDLKNNSSITIDSVIGLDEIKKTINTLIEAEKNQLEAQKHGFKTPKGIIFAGLPGCGKTFFGKILAKQLGYNFIYVSAAQLISPIDGIGKKNVSRLFELARNNKKVILFIDEIDAIAKSREKFVDSDHGGIIQQFLTELDGYSDNEGIIVIVATNTLDQIDNAFKRSGRFDLQFVFSNPSYIDRALYFKNYKVKEHNENFDVETAALITENLSYADLHQVILGAKLKSFQDKITLNNNHVINSVMDIKHGKNSSKHNKIKSEDKLIKQHLAAHTYAYALFGPQYFVFGQTQFATSIKCAPVHRSVKIYRSYDYIIELLSILTVKYIELKEGSATNWYQTFDSPKIKTLVIKLLDTMSKEIIFNEQEFNNISAEIISYLFSYIELFDEKYNNIYINIFKLYENVNCITRNDLYEILENHGLSKNLMPIVKEEIEKEINNIITKHNASKIKYSYTIKLPDFKTIIRTKVKENKNNIDKDNVEEDQEN